MADGGNRFRGDVALSVGLGSLVLLIAAARIACVRTGVERRMDQLEAQDRAWQQASQAEREGTRAAVQRLIRQHQAAASTGPAAATRPAATTQAVERTWPLSIE